LARHPKFNLADCRQQRKSLVPQGTLLMEGDMKLSTMLSASILALAAASPNAGPAVAQSGGAQDKVVRPAKCPAGQRLNAQKRKCEAEATTVTSAGASPQSAEAVTLEQCIGSGGTWTAGVCSSAEQQCIGSGGTWTNGVCIKE
jgi:hypothetical protein